MDMKPYTHIHLAFGHVTRSFALNVSHIQLQWELFKNLSEVKKILSLGGWSFSTEPATYSILRDAVKPANRGSFIANIVSFVKAHVLDGIDIDWEYPAADIPDVSPGTTEDAANYLTFLVALRAAIPSGKSVSFCAPASFWYLKGYPIAKMAAVADYIVYMTYDLHGQWDYANKFAIDGCPAGNCLRSQTNITETLLSLSMITKAGVPSNKVAVGVTSYGRSFQMTTPGCTGPMCTYTGGSSGAYPGPCTGTAGYIANAEINAILGETGTWRTPSGALQPIASYSSHFDTDSHSNIAVLQALTLQSTDTATYKINPVQSITPSSFVYTLPPNHATFPVTTARPATSTNTNIPGGRGNTQGPDGSDINDPDNCEEPVTASACTYLITSYSTWPMTESARTTETTCMTSTACNGQDTATTTTPGVTECSLDPDLLASMYFQEDPADFTTINGQRIAFEYAPTNPPGWDSSAFTEKSFGFDESITLVATSTSSSTATLTTTVEVPPTAKADCSIWNYGTSHFLTNIENISGWSTDGGALLKIQEGGCDAWGCRVEKWNWIDGSSTKGASVSFYLPILIKGGCVERAIVSAGGPKITCINQGGVVEPPPVQFGGGGAGGKRPIRKRLVASGSASLPSSYTTPIRVSRVTVAVTSMEDAATQLPTVALDAKRATRALESATPPPQSR